MPAMIENMGFVGQVPWHNLGNVIDEKDAYDSGKFTVSSGLDWGVNTEDVFLADGRKCPAKAVVRDSDKSVLGIVGPRFVPLQNKEAFGWFQPFLDSKEVRLETAGSLCSGSRVWVLAKINRNNSEIVKGDEIAKYLMLSNSHDGTLAVRVGFTPIRIVCANTLAAAHGNKASKLIRVRHSSGMKKNLESVRETVDMVNEQFEATAEQYRFLASRKINQADLRKFVKVVWGEENTKEEDLATRTKNTINRLIELVENGLGSTLPGVQGTYWGAYNGVTQYLAYEDSRNDSNRYNSLWFGQNANLNEFALQTALDMANAV